MFHCYVRLFFEGIQKNHTLRQAKDQSASSLPDRRTRPSPAHHFHPCQTLKTLAWLIPTKQQTMVLCMCPQRHKSWKICEKISTNTGNSLGICSAVYPKVFSLRRVWVINTILCRSAQVCDIALPNTDNGIAMNRTSNQGTVHSTQLTNTNANTAFSPRPNWSWSIQVMLSPRLKRSNLHAFQNPCRPCQPNLLTWVKDKKRWSNKGHRPSSSQ